MMAPDMFETLRQVNDNLVSALTRLSPEQKHCSDIRPQDLSNLLNEILRAAECLRCLQANCDVAAALQQQSLEYHRNLEKLSHFLPQLQRNLLAEKSRLETAQIKVAAAAAWVQTNQKTL